MPNGEVILNQDRVATSWKLDRARSHRFLCRLGGGLPERGFSPDIAGDVEHGEVVVGHENHFRFARCWRKHDYAFRGAVRFNLAEIPAGFHETQDAWLTWALVTDDRAPRNFGPRPCRSAAVGLSVAVTDWEEGFYPEDERDPRHHLGIGQYLYQVVDRGQPGDVGYLYRRIKVTPDVRQWVEGMLPNLGFVFIGYEAFSRPHLRLRSGSGVLVGGESSPYVSHGFIWERCMAIYRDFRLEIHDRGYIPPER